METVTDQWLSGWEASGRAHTAVGLFCVALEWWAWAHVRARPPRESLTEPGLWVVLACQCGPTAVRDRCTASREGDACGGQLVSGRLLYLPLNLAVTLKPL